jgi:SlyX protein
MSDDETLSARIDRLETRIAYQDEIVEDLNETITAQWKQIDRLTRQVAQLLDRVNEAEDKAGSGAPDRPPPHY